MLDWYVEKCGEALSAAERSWLQAQKSAWLSIWEVLEVEKGHSLTLRDLLTHETRRVWEKSASETLVHRDALLARVVDHNGVSWLCGTHPRVLPPRHAAEVVRFARGRLRRKRAVPVERLRDDKLGRYLIRRWEDAADAIASFQSRYYEAWLDEPIPALGGETPRRAALTAKGRTKVDELIKKMENLEARRPAAMAFDFGGIRRELKLD